MEPRLKPCASHGNQKFNSAPEAVHWRSLSGSLPEKVKKENRRKPANPGWHGKGH